MAALLIAFPAPAAAERRDTDVICGGAMDAASLAEVDRPDIVAPEAIVVGKDGTVYFERDADKQVKIASTTKVMTAIVALENSKPSDVITVDHAAATVGQSSAGLEEGDKLSRDDAVKALLVPSGNDAGMALASCVGALMAPGDPNPYQVFVDAMNKKAQELGMTGTLFTNPHGLDFDGWEGDLHSTARDVATMFAYGMKNEEFRTLIAQPVDTSVSVTKADGTQEDLKLKGHNKILGQEGNIGGKTGTTYDADSCYVGAFSQEKGGEVYTVILGSDNDDHRWSDTLSLASWYFSHWVDYPLIHATGKTVNGNPLVGRAPNIDWTDKAVEVTASDATKTVRIFSLAGTLHQKLALDELSGSIKRGEAAGTLTLMQGDAKLATERLVTDEDQPAPNPFEWAMVQLDRFLRLMAGKPGVAAAQKLNDLPAATELDAAA